LTKENKNMFKAFFGDISNGRLMRLPYLGYSLLLALLVIGFGFAIVLAIGIGEHLIGGDLQQAQDKLREWFTLPFLVVFTLVSALFFFAGLNIMAKRIRDTGLPGWWVVLVIIVLGVIASYFISEQAGSGLHTLIWIALLLIPTNALTRRA
jgi:uncharacterized membrane protein YhaH (DUF805 family)